MASMRQLNKAGCLTCDSMRCIEGTIFMNQQDNITTDDCQARAACLSAKVTVLRRAILNSGIDADIKGQKFLSGIEGLLEHLESDARILARKLDCTNE